jgi:hypothetical protein
MWNVRPRPSSQIAETRYIVIVMQHKRHDLRWGATLAAALALNVLGSAFARFHQNADRVTCPSAEHAAVADRVAEVFQSRRFAFIGSTHGGVKRHRFLLCLLSRPSFRATVTDIVVEFGSGAHQEVLDRYLIGLEDLPADALRQLALDTDYPQLLATLPQVPEFLEAVREVNEGTRRAERIRVLGGNENVDWSAVRTRDDMARYPFKTNYTAHLIIEHLEPDPDRRVLVVYGDGHITHGGGTLMSNLEAALDADSLLVIGTIVDIEEAERNLVAAFGDPSAPFFLDETSFPDVGELPGDIFYAEAGELAQKIDALVYLGPSPDTNLQGTIPFTDAESRELSRRDRLGGREAMEIRFGGRERWFEGHPHEIPPDPRQEPGG